MKTLLATAFLFVAAPPLANPASAETPSAPHASAPAAAESLRPVDLLIMRTDNNLAFHPDQQFRHLGVGPLRTGACQVFIGE